MSIKFNDYLGVPSTINLHCNGITPSTGVGSGDLSITMSNGYLPPIGSVIAEYSDSEGTDAGEKDGDVYQRTYSRYSSKMSDMNTLEEANTYLRVDSSQMSGDVTSSNMNFSYSSRLLVYPTVYIDTITVTYKIVYGEDDWTSWFDRVLVSVDGYTTKASSGNPASCFYSTERWGGTENKTATLTFEGIHRPSDQYFGLYNIAAPGSQLRAEWWSPAHDYKSSDTRPGVEEDATMLGSTNLTMEGDLFGGTAAGSIHVTGSSDVIPLHTSSADAKSNMKVRLNGTVYYI